MSWRRCVRGTAAGLLLALASCAAVAPPREAAVVADIPPPAPDARLVPVLAAEGLKHLRENRLDEASRIFNAGLKLVPDSAQMHFLNGFTYHLMYLRGGEAMRELAAIGYELALDADPSHYHAALQLGRLELHARRPGKAQAAFRRAVAIDSQEGAPYLGLASASYQARDLPAARAAIESALPRLQQSAEAERAAALIHAALGDEKAARAALTRYAALEPAAGPALERRVGQWRAWHAVATPEERIALAAAPPEPLRLAQASAAATPAATLPREPALPDWSDCGTAAAPTFSGSASVSGADETTPIAALPPSCKGAGLPRMAVLEIAIVRTEDEASTSHGINLLNGLSYVLNQSRAVTDVLATVSGAPAAPQTRTTTITRTRDAGLPTSGIQYSLNIANASDSRNEVLARPSLVALDRRPSTFFSGKNLTLGIAGQAGGSSAFTDKPIGVSLSVTPTFIDADTMLVAVRAARSFIEEVDFSVAFPQSLQASRNSVAANVVLKFGQTLILSGLTEQEVERVVNGVPVLQDIPVLQYFFRAKTSQTFTRSVLVVLTPRRPELEAEPVKLEDAHGGARRHARENRLWLQFRSGDLRNDEWTRPQRLQSLLQQLGELLYF